MKSVYPQYYKAEQLGIECILLKNATCSYPLHNHVNVFTIGMVVCGKVRISIGNKTSLYISNDTFIIRPYEPHSIISEGPCDMVCLCVNKIIVEKCNVESIQKAAISVLKKAAGDQFVTEQQTAILSNLIFSLGGLSQLDFHLASSYIQQLKNTIESHPEEEISIEKMSHQAFVSKYHLIRSFRKAVGLTPHQFQIQNRIRKAQHLFDQITSITEVALTTGFCDQSHFIKQFEKIVGLTPTCYKNSCRQISSGQDLTQTPLKLSTG